MPSLVPEITDKPATHVLVIGVSQYRHFDGGPEPTQNGDLLDMAQLTSTARSASEFAAWIRNHYRNGKAPLGSLRVLLSPAPGEVIHPDIAGHATDIPDATVGNVEQELIAFRATCNLHQESVAIMYIAGHGVQLTKTGSIVLLHDCGSPQHASLLKGAIDVAGVRAAFNHQDTAQTQFWFVDACRQKPAIARRFETLTGALTLDEPVGTAKATATFLAAVTGTNAFARPGGITLFWEALQWGLQGGVAVEPDRDVSPKWHVSAHGLHKRLGARVKDLAVLENAEQTVDSEIRFDDALFHEYPDVPKVDFSVEVLPAEAAQASEGFLQDEGDNTIVQTTRQWPMRDRVDAGIYKLMITPANGAGFQPYRKFHNLKPPEEKASIELSP